MEIGYYVKVPIYEGINVEKLWFEVMFIDGDGTFIGRCDNVVIGIAGIDINQHVKLNISDIIEKIK